MSVVTIIIEIFQTKGFVLYNSGNQARRNKMIIHAANNIACVLAQGSDVSDVTNLI